MMRCRRWMLRFLCLLLLGPTLTHTGASANEYPAGVVRIIASQPPGGTLDVLARSLAQKLSARWGGRAVIVENKPGAGGIIAGEFVARSKPDGLSLLITGDWHVASRTLFAEQMKFDPVTDFEPIVILVTTPVVLVVRHDFGAENLQEFLAIARRRELTVSTPGQGNANHLTLLELQGYQQGSFRNVPYKGAGPAITAVLGGEVDAGLVAVPGAMAHVRAGRMKALAVAGKRRSSALPNVPTFQEAGLPLLGEASWIGLLAPRGTPVTVVTQIQQLANSILSEPAFRASLTQVGFNIVGDSPSEFRAVLQHDAARFPRLLSHERHNRSVK
jgi:tripartite-type tricarboxylate transporter receptor subunit TctC